MVICYVWFPSVLLYIMTMGEDEIGDGVQIELPLTQT